MKYACIHAHREEFEVRLMCRVLAVSASGYYAWRTRAPSARARSSQRLLLQIRATHRRSRGSYGSPRVHHSLLQQGLRCGRNRVARLMKQAGLAGRPKGRKHRHGTAAQTQAPAPNLLARDFRVEAPNRVWAADLTYIPTAEGWLYLAVVLDLFSRRVVGYAMGETMEAALAAAALQEALHRRRPPAGLLHHSDRGSQFTSTLYQNLLQQHGLRCSMSGKGDCWDNAVVESFFSTLKRELLPERPFPTRAYARRQIETFIHLWYNHRRLHSTLGYHSPAVFELRQAA